MLCLIMGAYLCITLRNQLMFFLFVYDRNKYSSVMKEQPLTTPLTDNDVTTNKDPATV